MSLGRIGCKLTAASMRAAGLHDETDTRRIAVNFVVRMRIVAIRPDIGERGHSRHAAAATIGTRAVLSA